MVCSLRYAVFKIYGKIDYLHYYRRMIRDFETANWNFDIRTLVQNIKVDIPCPKYVCKRGLSKRLCLTITDDKAFEKEFSKYMNEYVYPLQEIRKNKILARKIWIKKHGFITKYNQDCSRANYVCKNCLSKSDCQLSKSYNKGESTVLKMTKMLELLYGNLSKGYWAELAEKVC